MNIKIDEIWIEVDSDSKNIVDVARNNNISIHAPCYLNKRKHGCCNACHIIANNEPTYACVTKPEDLMEVLINTEELINKRKASVKRYVHAINNNEVLECNCECDCGDTEEVTDSCCASGCNC